MMTMTSCRHKDRDAEGAEAPTAEGAENPFSVFSVFSVRCGSVICVAFDVQGTLVQG